MLSIWNLLLLVLTLFYCGMVYCRELSVPPALSVKEKKVCTESYFAMYHGSGLLNFPFVNIAFY